MPNEKLRLANLYELDILDSDAEECFDDITSLAASICSTPISLISLSDKNRQWFKSHFGLEVAEVPKELAICSHTVKDDRPFIISDLSKDSRFIDNPLVIDGMKLRFYAGIPLRSSSGVRIGALCVIDTTPRELMANQIDALIKLAKQTEKLLRLRLECKLHTQLKDELRSSEIWAHTLFDNSTDMMGIIEVSGEEKDEFKIVSVNSAYCEKMRVKEIEVKHRLLKEVLPKSIIPEIMFHFRRVFNTKRSVEFEIYFTLGEEKFWFESLITPKFEETKEISHLLIVSRDVTERKKSEEIIAQQNLKLAKSAKFSELGELAGSMAHEINNPLTIIVSRSEKLKTLLEKNEFEHAFFKKSIIQINDTAHRIAKIVRSLKNISRHADSDPMSVTNLKSIIEDAQSLCEERLKTADIKFTVNYPEHTHVDIEARAAQITQVLINLINNSVHAISNLDEKWIDIKIDESYDKQNLIIRTTDSGKGIPAHIQKKIMDPFFTTKEVGVGTGLGLSISRGIIEGHRGSFYYDATSTNTCFIIEIPRSHNKLKIEA